VHGVEPGGAAVIIATIYHISVMDGAWGAPAVPKCRRLPGRFARIMRGLSQDVVGKGRESDLLIA